MYLCTHKAFQNACFQEFDLILEQTNMALAIKSIPDLCGEDAVRFREEIEKVDKKNDSRPERKLTEDPRYATMKKILSKAKLF